MRKETILKMEKKGDDFMLTIPQGTCGKDVEIALATAIVEISKHQRQTHPTFKSYTLIRSIESWARIIESNQ